MSIILVFGRSGQIATALARTRAPAGFGVVCLGRREADLTDPATVFGALAAVRPALVINAAGYTDIDRAEAEPAAAYAVNRDGAATVAEACATWGVPLIHLSTDHVFDGTKPAPYFEDDPVNPLSVYGASEAAGEAAVRRLLRAHVIVRTAWVYSPYGDNFVTRMCRLATRRPELAVVCDQVGCPTSACRLAETVLRIAGELARGRRDGFGTFHYCGAGATSWYGFARAIFAMLGVGPTLRPIPAARAAQPARRPARVVLTCGRLKEVYGIMPRPWEEGVAETLGRFGPCEAVR